MEIWEPGAKLFGSQIFEILTWKTWIFNALEEDLLKTQSKISPFGKNFEGANSIQKLGGGGGA